MTETHSHLDRLRTLTAPAAERAEDEYAAFGFGRVGAKPQLTLRVRRVSGACHGFAYAHLYTLDFEPSVGIVLRFSQHRVVLQGRNLDELYRYLAQHRVDVVQVVDPMQADVLVEAAAVVTSVEVTAVREFSPAGG